MYSYLGEWFEYFYFFKDTLYKDISLLCTYNKFSKKIIMLIEMKIENNKHPWRYEKIYKLYCLLHN